MLAAGLAFAPVAALAQQTPASPPPDSVGPRALQDFSLNGTVTRPADQPVAQPASPAARKPIAEARSAPPQTKPVTRTAAATTLPARQIRTAAAEPPIPQSAPPPQPQSTPTVALPKTVATPTPTPAAAPSFPAAPQSPGVFAAAHDYPVLAWLLEALVLVLAGAFLFWRTKGRLIFAGHANFDLFTAPEPEPAPAPPAPPAPAPRAAPKAPAPPATTGVVSTRLRPWIDIGFQPVRCVLDEQRVVVEFDLELFNSGSAPARSVLVEARLFNAGADQDAQIAAFFANPVGAGERIDVIPPLKRLAVRTQAVVLREQMQAYELAGRPVFVPLIAFNVLYGWSGGEGQTSVSHLIGRDTKGEKLGPFRLDLGPHIFRNLGARLLPTAIRR